MVHPVKHSAEAMLDTARQLIIEGGPGAASARAVAQRLGAPSGSIYHRFPRRDDLIAAAWLRAEDRFLAAYLGELDGDVTPQSAVGAAVTVATWSLEHRADAMLLLQYALRDLVRAEINPELQARAHSNQRRLLEVLTKVAAGLDRDVHDLTLAVVDLPYAVTRRLLRTGNPGDTEIAALQRAAARLLAP